MHLIQTEVTSGKGGWDCVGNLPMMNVCLFSVNNHICYIKTNATMWPRELVEGGQKINSCYWRDNGLKKKKIVALKKEKETQAKSCFSFLFTLPWKWRQTWFFSSVSLCRVVGLDTWGIEISNFPFPCCLRTAAEMCLSSKVHSLPCVKMVRARVLIHFAWEVITRHHKWVKTLGWPRGSWIHFGPLLCSWCLSVWICESDAINANAPIPLSVWQANISLPSGYDAISFASLLGD